MWWSWILAAVGITGIYLAGSKRLAGWAIGVGAQVLWVAYAVSTRQWGFLVTAVAYGWVYTRNWLRWARRTYHCPRCAQLVTLDAGANCMPSHAAGGLRCGGAGMHVSWLRPVPWWARVTGGQRRRLESVPPMFTSEGRD